MPTRSSCPGSQARDCLIRHHGSARAGGPTLAALAVLRQHVRALEAAALAQVQQQVPPGQAVDDHLPASP